MLLFLVALNLFQFLRSYRMKIQSADIQYTHGLDERNSAEVYISPLHRETVTYFQDFSLATDDNLLLKLSIAALTRKAV